MDVEVVQNALRIAVDRTAGGTHVHDVLVDRLYLPAAFVRRLFADGRVRVGSDTVTDQTPLKAGHRLWLMGGVDEGDSTHVERSHINDPIEPLPVDLRVDALAHMPAEALPVDTLAIEPLYEDAHALVVNKPAGVLVHPGSDADVDTLASRVVHYFADEGLRRRARHVHRLDRDTTGTLLYAKHEYAARSFDYLLGARRITRQYVALVSGRPPRDEGSVSQPIGRDRHVSGRYRVSPSGKPATTHYRVLATQRLGNESASLVACTLESGRTHQIRVHLAAIGCPVVGDVLYGGSVGIGDIGDIVWPTGHALHAWRLGFWHPYREEEVDVRAPLPQFFQDVVRNLHMASAWTMWSTS